MQYLRLYCWLPAIMILTACTITPLNERVVISGTPEPTEELMQQNIVTGADALLEILDGPVITGSGAGVFRETGIVEIGDPHTPNTLSVFTEYHCGYCNEFQKHFLPKLQENFIDAGNLRVRFIPFPLQKYPNSTDAIKGILCAGEMGKGWEMHELLTERENKHRSSVLTYAEELGMEQEPFSQCLDSEKTSQLLDDLKMIAETLDIKLLPAFFLGDEKIVGLPLYADLRGWMETHMNE